MVSKASLNTTEVDIFRKNKSDIKTSNHMRRQRRTGQQFGVAVPRSIGSGTPTKEAPGSDDPLIRRIVDHGTIGLVSENVDLSELGGNFHSMILSDNISITFTGAPDSPKVQRFIVHIKQDGAGGNTVTWNNLTSTPPTIDTSAGAVTNIEIYTFDGGTTYYSIQGSGGGGGGASFPLDYIIDDQGTKSSGTVTHDLSTSTAHMLKFTIGGDLTVAFSNYPASGTGIDWYVEVTQDGTGGHTITWPSEIINTPTLTETADTVSLVAFHTNDNGTVVRAITLLNASPSSGDFASKQLDDLSSPVLNTPINFNSNAPTGFSGYVSPIVGNTMSNDANGTTWTLPPGDSYKWQVNGLDQLEVTEAVVNVKDNTLTQYVGWTAASGQTSIVTGSGVEHTLPMSDTYDWKIAGTSEFVISSLGIAVNESIQLSDTAADPATNGEIQRNGTDVKVYTGGSVVNLSDLSGAPFDDNQVIIQDEIDNTKTLSFNLSLVSTGAANLLSWASGGTRTHTFSATSGTIAQLNLAQSYTATQTFQGIDFDANGTRDIGSTTTHANDIFTENLTFRGNGSSLTSTRPMIAADTNNMIFHVPSADDFVFQVNGSTTKMQFNTTGASDDIRIRAGAARVLGFITDSSATTIGTSGTIKIPVDSGSVGTAAAADTDFGDDVGCIGLYLNTIGSGNPVFCIKIDDGTGTDNRWIGIIMNRTTGALTGSVLT